MKARIKLELCKPELLKNRRPSPQPNLIQIWLHPLTARSADSLKFNQGFQLHLDKRGKQTTVKHCERTSWRQTTQESIWYYLQDMGLNICERSKTMHQNAGGIARGLMPWNKNTLN